MHPVLKSHLDYFVDEFGLAGFDLAKAFEAFVNYCLISKYYYGKIVPQDHVYEGDDPGIDGVMFIIDGELVSTTEEAAAIFGKPKRNIEVKICCSQAKSGEKYSKSDINVFQSGIIDFFKPQSVYPQDEYLTKKKEILDCIFSNLRKVKSGRPEIYCYYATGGQVSTEREVVAALEAFKQSLIDLDYFSFVDVIHIGRDELVHLWMRSVQPVSVQLQIIANAHFPATEGISESYVVTVKAKEFVEKVLCDETGYLRKGIFDENIRDFLGLDNAVNNAMNETLRNDASRKRFGILNNGITIISPDVLLSTNSLNIENFQIVNGCQTSNVLYENRDDLLDDVNITVKVIETTDSEIIDEIVKTTNNQTKVEDHQFLATLEMVKKIERFFVARSAAEDQNQKLYFARRQNQFAQEGVPSIRIFDIRELSRCSGAMFFERPDLATRYPNQLMGELRDDLFDCRNREEIYYTAAYTLYRLLLHFSNGRLPNVYRKFKWYIMMIIKLIVFEGKAIQFTDKKVDSLCLDIKTIMSGNDESQLDFLLKCCHFMDPFLDATEDRMKRQAFVTEVKENFFKTRAGLVDMSKS